MGSDLQFSPKLEFDPRMQSKNTTLRDFSLLGYNKGCATCLCCAGKWESILAISISSSPAVCFTAIRDFYWWYSRIMCSGNVRRDCVLPLDIIKKIFGLIVITDPYQWPGEEIVRMHFEFQIPGWLWHIQVEKNHLWLINRKSEVEIIEKKQILTQWNRL